MRDATKKFVTKALEIGAIELFPGGLKLKSRRMSPYFFNSALFNTGKNLQMLIEAYAETVMEMCVDTCGGIVKEGAIVVYGPAYKGIPLSVAVSLMLWMKYTINLGYAFNRKEAKDHGEGGIIVGSSIKNKNVLIIDDVMTTGTSSGEAVEIVRANGGIPIGCVIAFDRQERGTETNISAVQEFQNKYGIPVRATATLADLIDVLQEEDTVSGIGKSAPLRDILDYQARYGAQYA